MEKLQQHFIRIRNLLDIAFFRVLFFLLLGIVLYAAMFSNVKPEKLNLDLFSVAGQTIRSPGTVEDKQSTDRKRKEARDQVQDVYSLKKEYTQNRVDLITSIFQSAIDVNDEVNGGIKQQIKSASDKSTNAESDVENKTSRLKAKLTSTVTSDLSNQVFSSLVQASNEELSIAKDLTVTAINKVMAKRIPANEVENAKKKVEEELKYTTLNENLRQAAVELGRYAIIQNEFYDPAATKELRQQAAESVEPVKILQGQIIVEEGKLINQDIYRQLKLVGLLDNSTSFKPFIGLVVLIILILSAIYYFFYQMKSVPEKKQTFLLLYGFIFILSIFIMKIISYLQIFNFSGIGYLFPAAMAGMMIKILIDEKLAILMSVILSVSGSILFNEGVTGTMNYSEGIYILFSALAGILFLSKQNQRSKILQAGLFTVFINLVTILILLYLPNGQFSGKEYGYYFITALVSGFGSAVLTMGLLPFFEASFGILSTMRLIELSSPNHPLLRKILMEAPGTYHHSVMVANLSESACEAIGANGLLARVGSYYHDIGKTRRPNFFIENQMHHDNPHDQLPPDKSVQIVIAHVTDGSSILKKRQMPKEIIDITEQHHGTTLLKYFYHKSCTNDPETQENDFRYPGPKAQSKEAAVVGIADSVEAAVRSLKHPTAEAIESMVKKIVDERVQDGQLNECDLTLKEIERVAHTLCETLKGIFHSRIEYPDLTKKVKQA